MANTVPFFFPAGPNDERLLADALQGDSGAWTRLTRRFQPYLMVAIRRRAGALPADQQVETRAEVWAAIFLRGASTFDPHTMSARDYIASFVKDATDRVRAAYRPPGERSRARDGRRPRKRAALGVDQPQLAVVSLDRLPEDEQPQAQDTWEGIDRGFEVERAQVMAASDVALAIDLIRQWGVNFEEAALMVGLTRVTLLRRLAQLGRRPRAA